MNQQTDATTPLNGSATPPAAAAPLLRWLCAMTYDGVLLFCLWLILGIAFIALNPRHTLPWWATQGLLWVSTAGYFIYCWSSARGQTVGALAWKLYVISTNHSSGCAPRLSKRQACLRFLAATGSLLFCGLGHLWRLFDPEEQTAYDRCCQTRIVYIPSKCVSLTGQPHKQTR